MSHSTYKTIGGTEVHIPSMDLNIPAAQVDVHVPPQAAPIVNVTCPEPVINVNQPVTNVSVGEPVINVKVEEPTINISPQLIEINPSIKIDIQGTDINYLTDKKLLLHISAALYLILTALIAIGIRIAFS